MWSNKGRECSLGGRRKQLGQLEKWSGKQGRKRSRGEKNKGKGRGQVWRKNVWRKVLREESQEKRLGDNISEEISVQEGKHWEEEQEGKNGWRKKVIKRNKVDNVVKKREHWLKKKEKEERENKNDDRKNAKAQRNVIQQGKFKRKEKKFRGKIIQVSSFFFN